MPPKAIYKVVEATSAEELEAALNVLAGEKYFLFTVFPVMDTLAWGRDSEPALQHRGYTAIMRRVS
jgi:hypothetical protein